MILAAVGGAAFGSLSGASLGYLWFGSSGSNKIEANTLSTMKAELADQLVTEFIYANGLPTTIPAAVRNTPQATKLSESPIPSSSAAVATSPPRTMAAGSTRIAAQESAPRK